MRTANPALGDATFSDIGRAAAGESMTIQGTVNKTIALLFQPIGSGLYR